MCSPAPSWTVSTERAIELVQSCGRDDRVILGLDGFEVVSEGYIARLDLILDLSIGDAHLQRSPASLACEAEGFIKARAATNIVWEVVIDN